MRIVERYPVKPGNQEQAQSHRETAVDQDIQSCFNQFIVHLRREGRLFSRLVTAQNSEPGVKWSMNLNCKSQVGQVICQIIQGSTDLDVLASKCGADKALLEKVIVLWIQLKQQINKELIGQIHTPRRKLYLSSDEAA